MGKLVLLVLTVSGVFGQLCAESTRPNILFIFTDQQHSGMMSCAGNPYLQTPAMDSLAAEGTRFELAYATNPVCVPSRVSLMTGVMPSRIGMEENADSGSVSVSEGLLQYSLGRVFRNAGYETAYGGKVHLPMPIESVGFETISKDQRDQLAEDCVNYLRRKHDKPFLLVASFINPHDICYMAIRSHGIQTGGAGEKAANRKPQGPILDEALQLPAGMSRDEFFKSKCPPLPLNFEIPSGEPEAVRQVDPRDFRFFVREHWTDEDWRLHRWAYCRLTERVDSQIGQVLAALRETGLDRNTVVVFTSDHGDMDAAHRLEHKSVLYEEAARVPMIVAFKGVTQPGAVDSKHLVSVGLDLIPTLCDYAGISAPSAWAGRSLRPLAEGREVGNWRKSVVVESNSSRMIRTERYKYTVYDSGRPREVLVDLKQDPGEMRNLAGDGSHQTVLQAQRKLLLDWYQENGEKLPSEYVVR